MARGKRKSTNISISVGQSAPKLSALAVIVDSAPERGRLLHELYDANRMAAVEYVVQSVKHAYHLAEKQPGVFSKEMKEKLRSCLDIMAAQAERVGDSNANSIEIWQLSSEYEELLPDLHSKDRYRRPLTYFARKYFCDSLELLSTVLDEKSDHFEMTFLNDALTDAHEALVLSVLYQTHHPGELFSSQSSAKLLLAISDETATKVAASEMEWELKMLRQTIKAQHFTPNKRTRLSSLAR